MSLKNLKRTKQNTQIVHKTERIKLLQKKALFRLDESKYFPASVREWKNSLYYFDKNNINLIPYSSAVSISLIKIFFNFYYASLEKKMRSKRLLLRLRRLSLNKIFLSDGKFKHNNNKVLIDLHLFNKQKWNYFYKLKKIYLSRIKKKSFIFFLSKSLNKINQKSFFHLNSLNKSNYLLKRALFVLYNNENYSLRNYKSLNKYIIFFYRKLLKTLMKKYRLFYFYKQLIYLNKSKTNYSYLRILKKYLEIIYNKNVEFNLVNLKAFYLDSDIFSEIVKLKITKKRQKLNRIFRKFNNLIKIQRHNFLSIFEAFYKNKNKESFVLNSLKYRHITGFRLEARGRLTKRYTASRSKSKFVNSGTLLNIDSSKRGLSSVILKGNLKSNIQYTKMQSKTRIGSFGIKGWVSGT